MMLSDLKTKLKSHDWFYMMSDDNRAYTKGSAQQSEIRKLIKSLEAMGMGDEAKNLYNKYAPYREGGPDFRMKEAKKEFPDLTGDGKVTKADILKGRGVELKEDWGGSDQYAMNQSIHKDLGAPTEFPSPFDSKFSSAVESAVDFFWDDWEEYRTDREGLVNKAMMSYYRAYFPEKLEGFMKMFSENLNEDMDLGHQDNEPHMLKGDLYRIGKYAMELYQMVDQFEGQGEVDFPAWWQAKITTAAYNMVSAKHYLDFETKEPEIDAALGVATSEEPMMGEPMMEGEINEIEVGDMVKIKKEYGGGRGEVTDKKGSFIVVNGDSYHESDVDVIKSSKKLSENEINAEETLAGKIAKALKNPKNKSSEDQNNIKQARKAMNKGDIKTAEKIVKPYN
jgi:hypothetical protein